MYYFNKTGKKYNISYFYLAKSFDIEHVLIVCHDIN